MRTRTPRQPSTPRLTVGTARAAARTATRTVTFAAAAAALLVAGGGLAQDLPVTPAPEGAKVTIVSPEDGATVESPVTVIFGLENMGVAPAGVDMEGTGHHHLLVDQTELPPAGKPMGEPPIHFGGGQTQTTIELEPGEHTLQLIMGDKLHVPHEPPIVSDVVTITVE